MKLSRIYQELLMEGAGGHSYGCVMLFLEAPKEWWDKIQSEIDDEDLYTPEGEREYGREPADNSHVTILYGLHGDVADEEVEERVKQMTAPEVTLKKIGMFDNADKGFDVIKFDIEDEELTRMNEMFKELPFTNDYDDYHAHATIAYVKAGTGKKYTRTLSKDEVLTLKPTKVVYSKPDGEQKEYKFD